MVYSIQSISVFEKQAKRLIKKYASLKKELLALVQKLKENPEQGTAIGKSCFKVLIAIASQRKGQEWWPKGCDHKWNLNITNPQSNLGFLSGSSSVGRASASQAEGREFEPRFPLKKKFTTEASAALWHFMGQNSLSSFPITFA